MTRKDAQARREWPTLSGVARRLGLSEARVRELVESGAIAETEHEDGARRYDPTDVERLAYELPPASPVVGADLLAQSVAMLRQCQAHEQSLMKLVLEPTSQLLSHYERLLASAHARETELERLRDEAISAREAWLDQTFERERVAVRDAKRDERLDRFLDPLVADAPGMLSAGMDLLGKVVGGEASGREK